jgi:hypothetical protein
MNYCYNKIIVKNLFTATNVKLADKAEKTALDEKADKTALA